eukprot:3698153-Amphidinium_carterae.1
MENRPFLKKNPLVSVPFWFPKVCKSQLLCAKVMVPSETPPHYTHCRTLPFVPLPPETELKLVKRKHEKRSCRLCFQPVRQYSEMPQVLVRRVFTQKHKTS